MSQTPLDGWMRETTCIMTEVVAAVEDSSFVEEKYEILAVEGDTLEVGNPAKTGVLNLIRQQRGLVGAFTEAGAVSYEEGSYLMKELSKMQKTVEEHPETTEIVAGSVFHASRFLPDFTLYERGRKKNPNPFIVAFDCDGVLYDFNTALKSWLTTRGWDSADLPDPTVYSLHDAWGLSSGTLHREMPEAVKAGALWHDGEPMEDGITTARLVGSLGHILMVNTARALAGMEKESSEATIIWLRKHGVHPDLFHLADPLVPGDKLRAQFDILFDDHPENVETALADGRQAFLIDRPWNVTYTDLPRITFAEVPELLAGMRTPMM